jgi:hypothetical protein
MGLWRSSRLWWPVVMAAGVRRIAAFKVALAEIDLALLVLTVILTTK